jgi:glycosyltransferase involved in cell wall biosynthesis
MFAELLPPLFGGAAQQALRLAAQLQASGARIFFIGGCPPSVRPGPTFIDGFTAYRQPWILSGKISKLRSLVGHCCTLYRRRKHFDILHVHGPYYLTLGPAWFAQRCLGKKLLVKLTLTGFDTPSAVIRGNYGALAWRAYRRADAFACMSSHLLNECRAHRLDPDKLRLIPNGVDAERYRPAASQGEKENLRQELELPPDARIVAFVGSIEARKGVDFLTRVAVRACRAIPKACFVLIGPNGEGAHDSGIDPDFVAHIRETIHRAGLEQSIRLLGRRENVECYLRAADVFLFTSRAEGFGTALIEAMSCGLPPVALEIPDVTRDIIRHQQDGIVIPAESVDSFNEALCRLLTDRAHCHALAGAARNTVLQRFALNVIAAQYLNLYEKLLGIGSSPSPPNLRALTVA